MIQITITIKHDLLDAGGLGLLGDQGANLGGLFGLRDLFVLDAVLAGTGGSQGLADFVVNQLHIDLLVASEDRHARTLGGTRNLLSDALLDELSSFFFSFSHFLTFLSEVLIFTYQQLYLPYVSGLRLRT